MDVSDELAKEVTGKVIFNIKTSIQNSNLLPLSEPSSFSTQKRIFLLNIDLINLSSPRSQGVRTLTSKEQNASKTPPGSTWPLSSEPALKKLVEVLSKNRPLSLHFLKAQLLMILSFTSNRNEKC